MNNFKVSLRRYLIFLDKFVQSEELESYHNHANATKSTDWLDLGTWTVWASPSAPAILVLMSKPAQNAKGQGRVEYRLQDVMMDKYTLGQSHHIQKGCETVL